MKNTRRTFLQSLAAVPLLGWAFASAKPAMPSLPPVKVDTSEPVYGFDERLTLKDLYGNHEFIAGEDLRRGDFVSSDWSLYKGRDPWGYPVLVHTIAKSTASDSPVGMVVENIAKGEAAGDAVLVAAGLAPTGE